MTTDRAAGIESAAVDDKPLLLSAATAAALVGKSVRTWRTWHAAGLIPAPIRIGRSLLWRPDELHAWVAAGCPPRDEWEQIRA